MEPRPKMDLGNECSIHEVVKDNEGISNISESRVRNDDHNEVKLNGADTEFTNSRMKRKGNGLKKCWRIRRDARKGGGGGEIVMTHELLNPGVSSSKRMQFSERKQKSEGSVSSTNAVVQNFDDFGLGLGPPFSAGTDSENSEERSSKSSTAASAPKLKIELPVIVSGRMRSLSGKNIGHQGSGRAKTGNKSREEQQVKIEKENSHSSLESDSRSSNFLFMQGIYLTGKGIQDERLKACDGENGGEVQEGGDEQQVTDSHRGSVYGEGGYEGGGVADSSSEVKEDRSENHGSSSDQDPLDESLFALQSAQEALEKEVLEFQEISKDDLVDDSISDIGIELTDDEQETSFSRAVQSDVLETGHNDTETEVEDLFKQKIEAEVEYMAISRTVQNLRVAAIDQITILEEQIALASEQIQILDKLGVAENKAAVIEKDAEKLEKICGDIASASEIMKLQKGVFKYSSCFLIQLVLLIVILGLFIFHFSPSYVGVVPT